ncbi:MAG: hypothetical protein PME_17360 [Priestia megaterium]
MSMKNKWLFNGVMVLFSWISISFLDWRSIKRFFPAFIFVFLINCIDVPIGKKFKWWSFYNKPNSFIYNENWSNACSCFMVIKMDIRKFQKVYYSKCPFPNIFFIFS